MPLLRLDIAGFRNLVSARLELLPQGFNYFYGKNGSGKTSLIESVYYAIYGRSFRTPNPAHLITHTVDQLTVVCHTAAGAHLPVYPLGVERWRDGRAKARIGGEAIDSFANIVRRFPALLAHAGSHHLLDAGPIFRRKFLDWGAFYQQDEFLTLWKRYARALRQRNTLLRQRKWGHELETWTLETVKSGVALHTARQGFVDALQPALIEALSFLLPLEGLKIRYSPGWKEDLSLAEACEHSADRDRQMGCTQSGPHRADFKLTINRMPAREVLSRGQQKLFVYAMILAQGALIRQHSDNPPVYLLDDLPAELDGESRGRLMNQLQGQKAQVLFTGIQPDMHGSGQAMKMFHVEHGHISEVR